MFLSNERNSIDSLENPLRSDFYCIVLTDLQGVENYVLKILLMFLFFKGSENVYMTKKGKNTFPKQICFREKQEI